MSSGPPVRGKAGADNPGPSEAKPEGDDGPSTWLFVVAMAFVLVPFAIVLIWVVFDAPKFLFQQ